MCFIDTAEWRQTIVCRRNENHRNNSAWTIPKKTGPFYLALEISKGVFPISEVGAMFPYPCFYPCFYHYST